MEDLSREEIISQLKRLGIYTPSELDSYFNQYKAYYKTTNFPFEKTIPLLKNGKEEIEIPNDRRKFRRFFISLDLNLKMLKEDNYFSGKIRNFSYKGFCFTSNIFDHKPRETLQCDIKLPREDKFISILCKAVWTRQTNDRHFVGAEIIEVDKEPIWKILDYAYERWCDINGYITNDRV